jgi:ABC-type transport system involved in multi-copper enzyme maturation permease subunit
MSLSAPDRPPSPAARADRATAEAVGIGIWVLAATGGAAWYWYGDRAFGAVHAAPAAILILSLAVLARGGLVRLFGPVLFYEALRAARRTRFFVLRWLYAIGLLLLLFWVHWIWGMENNYHNGPVEQAYKQQAKLAEQFFYVFAAVQFAVVVLLTPAYIAGAVAEEKERRTLEFLLATDLRGREIVFGKLLARLGNLTLLVMTGLPVLSLMQFFGGIDPGLLLASFAFTGLTAGSLAGLGILLSVQRRRARDAIILTYLAAAGYVTIASATLLIPHYWTEYHQEAQRTQIAVNPAFRQPVTAPYIEEIQSTVDWFNSGNPFFCLGKITYAVETGSPPLADELWAQMERYALVHGLFAVGCVALAVLRLRPVALAQAGALPRQKKRRFQLIRFRRPPVGRLPMLWKEVRVEGGLRFGWFGRILVALVVCISFVPAVIIVYLLFFDSYLSSINYHHAWTELGTPINSWVRVINPIVSSLMLLGVAVRAAGAFGSERDRDTLVSLMTTPLTTQEIYWAKWAGSLLSVRLFLVWLAVVWAVGLVCGAIGILAVPMQMVLWLIPAAFVASLGLYLSAVCKTTLRATTWAIAGTLFCLGGHWVCLGMCCYAPLTAAFAHSERSLEWLVDLQLGLTPPFLFWAAPFREMSELRLGDAKAPALYAAAQVIWLVGAAVVGHLAHEKIKQLTNRRELEHGQPQSLLKN